MPYCADGTIFDVSITSVISCIYGLRARTVRAGVVTSPSVHLWVCDGRRGVDDDVDVDVDTPSIEWSRQRRKLRLIFYCLDCRTILTIAMIATQERTEQQQLQQQQLLVEK
jgi:hypothetical protein